MNDDRYVADHRGIFDRGISHALYCGRCGYLLRGLPYQGTCPECGNQYDADPIRMEGIFLPTFPRFPLAYAAGLLVNGVLSIWLLAGAFNPFKSGQFYVGLLFTALSCVFGVQLCRRVGEHFRYVDLVRRIHKHEQDAVD